MKNWQFIIICILIILWFGVLYYQNNKELNYLWSIDTINRWVFQDTEYIKQEFNNQMDYIKPKIDETLSTVRGSWWSLNNNPILNP